MYRCKDGKSMRACSLWNRPVFFYNLFVIFVCISNRVILLLLSVVGEDRIILIFSDGLNDSGTDG